MTYPMDPTGSQLSDTTHLQGDIDGLKLVSRDIILSARGEFFFEYKDSDADESLVNAILIAEVARIIEAAETGAGRWDNASETSYVTVGDKLWTVSFADDPPASKDLWCLPFSEERFFALLEALHALAVRTLWGNHST